MLATTSNTDQLRDKYANQILKKVAETLIWK